MNSRIVDPGLSLRRSFRWSLAAQSKLGVALLAVGVAGLLPVSFAQRPFEAPRPALGHGKAKGLVSAPALAPSVLHRYAVQIINPPAGESPLDAWMNNDGLLTVTYQFFDDNGGEQGSAVVRQNQWQVLESGDVPFWSAGQPTSGGQIGGSYFVAGVPEELGAIYANGQFQLYPALPGLAGHNWRIYGVNDHGLMVGIQWDPHGDQPAQAIMTDTALSFVNSLNAPWATVTFPQAINNRSIVVGTGLVRVAGSAQYAGIYYSNGVFHQVSVPGTDYTYLNGVNGRGDAVGSYTPPGGFTRGLVLEKGAMLDFFIPGSIGTLLDSITDDGRLCGTVEDATGQDHVFVATPH